MTPFAGSVGQFFWSGMAEPSSGSSEGRLFAVFIRRAPASANISVR